jgi:dihydrofolate reductase (trimethoprim resistance protein)
MKFQLGDRVRKIKGSHWKGKVVGTYSTNLTPEGYAVESEAHPGSVQIYPAAALEAWNNMKRVYKVESQPAATFDNPEEAAELFGRGYGRRLWKVRCVCAYVELKPVPVKDGSKYEDVAYMVKAHVHMERVNNRRKRVLEFRMSGRNV